MAMIKGSRGHWSGKMGFILAAAGSAIGLGNIWKFPYMTGVSGGGAFVLIYLVSILIIGMPIMMAEIMIGRHTQKDPIGAFKSLKSGPYWLIGAMGILTTIIILSFYSVVAGWSIHFLYEAIFGFSGSDASIQNIFSNLYASGLKSSLWHTVFMLMVVGIVLGGVKNGIEKWNKILMPSLFIILIILMIYSLTLDGAPKALSFLFKPDFSKITPQIVLDALGQAFFTLSLGVCMMVTYGSYLNKDSNLPTATLTITALDTMIALIAGIVIFPIVFTFNVEPTQGPGLIFCTLPVLFAKMPGGYIIAIAFFTLLLFAALTSGISLLEVSVSYLIDEKKFSRKKATLSAGIAVYILGFLSAWPEIKIGKTTFFDIFDKLATNITMPLGGLLITLFAGWFISKQIKQDNLPKVFSSLGLDIWNFLIKYITPAFVFIIFIAKLYELIF
ncbi:MAG: sodium-dependent transporter [Pseudomonadota bacterium]